MASFDTFPSGGELDQNSRFVDAFGFVELYSCVSNEPVVRHGQTNINDMQSFVDRSLNIKGETCVNFSGDFAGNNLKDLLAEFNKKAV